MSPLDSLPPSLRKRGISIGDVGIIRTDGTFQFVFSIFAPSPPPPPPHPPPPPPRPVIDGSGDLQAEHELSAARFGSLQLIRLFFVYILCFFAYVLDFFSSCPSFSPPEDLRVDEDHSINCFGVPDDFEPMPWHPELVDRIEDKHCKNSALTSEGVSRENRNAHLEATMPGYGSTILPVISVCYEASSSSTETAVLAMPDGALGEKYRDKQSIQDYTMKNAMSWYQFINGKKGLLAPNGSVYVVTQCDKATAWGIATTAKGDGTQSVSLNFTAVKGIGAGAGYSCSWGVSSGIVARGSTISDFGDGVPQPHNQCLFIQGIKIMIRDDRMSKVIKRSQVKVEFTDKLPLKDLLHCKSHFPGANCGNGGANLSGNSSQHSLGSQDEQETETDDDWSEILEPNQQDHVYHPSDTMNRYILDNTDVDVAVTHESDWWALSPGPTLASEEEILGRIPDHYNIVVKSSLSLHLLCIMKLIPVFTKDGAFLSLKSHVPLDVESGGGSEMYTFQASDGHGNASTASREISPQTATIIHNHYLLLSNLPPLPRQNANQLTPDTDADHAAALDKAFLAAGRKKGLPQRPERFFAEGKPPNSRVRTLYRNMMRKPYDFYLGSAVPGLASSLRPSLARPAEPVPGPAQYTQSPKTIHQQEVDLCIAPRGTVYPVSGRAVYSVPGGAVCSVPGGAVYNVPVGAVYQIDRRGGGLEHCGASPKEPNADTQRVLW
ncbi:hypothetical protein HWV62_7650 [Athelia sp. TMB]|nr:hypothetical protein HWV62_7650 [Athelia sp. TMB]